MAQIYFKTPWKKSAALRMKRIGIIGGMGPQATIRLFQRILDFTYAAKDQDHFRIFIDNNPQIPDRTSAILHKGESPVNALIRSAKILEKAGADFVIIPCNNSHFYLKEIQRRINIPVLSMLEVTARFISERYEIVRRIGLLATRGTYLSRIYPKAFRPYGIRIVVPYKCEQDILMNIIYGIKGGESPAKFTECINNISSNLAKRGAELIVKGCTELSLVKTKKKDLYVDPLDLLASESVKFART